MLCSFLHVKFYIFQHTLKNNVKMNETRKIILWTVPRSVSTAFERSIMEIKDSKTFHEPYSMAYHLGPQKQSTVYTFEEIDPCNTYENIQAMLTKHYDGIKVIFAKDMAKAISNHLELLLDEAMKDYQHTFLIRDPRKALPSLYKTYVNPNAAGSNDFDPIEAGFVQFNQLYRFVKKYLDQNPVLIDADDLQQDPEGAMKGIYVIVLVIQLFVYLFF